jgi:hypothetical protein
MDNRRPRNFDSRENNERVKQWVPPSTLPTPNAQDGYKFRWVRTSLMGAADPTNVSARFREGWEPVKMEDHPELMLASIPGGKESGNVEVGGLTLCKMPTEIVDQRNSYYQQHNRYHKETAEQTYMRESDRRMPKFSERK